MAGLKAFKRRMFESGIDANNRKNREMKDMRKDSMVRKNMLAMLADDEEEKRRKGG